MGRDHYETPDVELEEILERLAPHDRVVAKIVDDEAETAHAVGHDERHEREQPHVVGRTNERNACGEHQRMCGDRPQFLGAWSKSVLRQQWLDLPHVVALRFGLWPHALVTSSCFFSSVSRATPSSAWVTRSASSTNAISLQLERATKRTGAVSASTRSRSNAMWLGALLCAAP